MESTTASNPPLVSDAQRHQATEMARFSGILQTLPPELMTLVVKFADWKDLPALRATSKVLNQIALPLYCETFFRRRRHVLSKHSLQALIDITAHPVFGPYVRTILIGSSRLSPEAMEGQHFATRVYHQLSNDELIHAYGCMVHEQRLLEGSLDTRTDLHSNSSTVVHQQLHVPGKLVEELPIGVQLLSTALDNIHSHGNTATIGVCDDVITAYRPNPIKASWYSEVKLAPDVASMYHKCEDFGDAAFFSAWGWKCLCSAINAAATSHCVTFTDEPFATIELLLQAKAASSCTVETLEIALGSGVMRQNWTSRISDKALASINEVSIYRSYHQPERDAYTNVLARSLLTGRDDKSVSLYNLLNKSTNVKSLGYFTPVNLSSLQSGLLANLQNLCLVNSWHGSISILRFIRRLPHSLRHLTLHSICIVGRLPQQHDQPGEIGLIAAMQCISQSLSIRRLQLYNVSSDQNLPCGHRMVLVPTKIWVLEGKRLVREKLNEAIMKLLTRDQRANP